jgi:hypothetical protein
MNVYLVDEELLRLHVEALQIALTGRDITSMHDIADRALRALLAKGPSEPVDYFRELDGGIYQSHQGLDGSFPLYRKDTP